jgi:MutS2 family protein
LKTDTTQVLGFDQIKEEIATYALTDSGKDRVLQLRISTNRKQIEAWQDEVNEAVMILEKSASVPLHGLNGIQLLLGMLNKGVPIRPDQFLLLHDFLDCCGKMRRYMKDKEYMAPRVSSYVYSIEELPSLADEINRCIRNGQVDDYASKELLKVRKQIAIQEERLKEKLNQIIRSNKYKTYLQEAVISQRNGRYVIPVKIEYKNKLKGSVLDRSASGSTLYIEPEDITAQQEQLDWLLAEEELEVEKILLYLTGLVEGKERELHLAVETMIHYDFLFAKAKYSRSIEGQPVNVNESHFVHLIQAKHPLLGANAVPLTIKLGQDGQHALIITGPNTGGKTVTIKTVGLLTMMVQAGLHIPVEKGSEISIFQHILVDIGDGQSIEQNLSTFSSRITNIIEILKETNDRSLVLLDELGSGTDPGEGMGLATAILEQLYQKGATLLATTHYSEIKGFAEDTDGFMNGSMEFDLETLKPTYRLLIGKGGESQAFAIALKLGVHPQIIERAHQITYKTKKTFAMEEADYYQRKEAEKQLANNRYVKRSRDPKEIKTILQHFSQGDNVQITITGEYGIIYQGPDETGNYIVQVKGEKQLYNQKRLKMYIQAKELYPEDYDFDVIFESKENRKIRHQMGRKHVSETIVDEEGNK